MLVLANQAGVTGIFLTMHYKAVLAEALRRSNTSCATPMGWLNPLPAPTVRPRSSIVVYLSHVPPRCCTARTAPRDLLWIFGCLIFLSA